jgi:hypothetical protein
MTSTTAAGHRKAADFTELRGNLQLVVYCDHAKAGVVWCAIRPLWWSFSHHHSLEVRENV